jgi:hypothetical protein
MRLRLQEPLWFFLFQLAFTAWCVFCALFWSPAVWMAVLNALAAVGSAWAALRMWLPRRAPNATTEGSTPRSGG